MKSDLSNVLQQTSDAQWKAAARAAGKRYSRLAELGQVDTALQIAQHEQRDVQARELFTRMQDLEERLGLS